MKSKVISTAIAAESQSSGTFSQEEEAMAARFMLVLQDSRIEVKKRQIELKPIADQFTVPELFVIVSCSKEALKPEVFNTTDKMVSHLVRYFKDIAFPYKKSVTALQMEALARKALAFVRKENKSAELDNVDSCQLSSGPTVADLRVAIAAAPVQQIAMTKSGTPVGFNNQSATIEKRVAIPADVEPGMYPVLEQCEQFMQFVGTAFSSVKADLAKKLRHNFDDHHIPLICLRAWAKELCAPLFEVMGVDFEAYPSDQQELFRRAINYLRDKDQSAVSEARILARICGYYFNAQIAAIAGVEDFEGIQDPPGYEDHVSLDFFAPFQTGPDLLESAAAKQLVVLNADAKAIYYVLFMKPGPEKIYFVTNNIFLADLINSTAKIRGASARFVGICAGRSTSPDKCGIPQGSIQHAQLNIKDQLDSSLLALLDYILAGEGTVAIKGEQVLAEYSLGTRSFKPVKIISGPTYEAIGKTLTAAGYQVRIDAHTVSPECTTIPATCHTQLVKKDKYCLSGSKVVHGEIALTKPIVEVAAIKQANGLPFVIKGTRTTQGFCEPDLHGITSGELLEKVAVVVSNNPDQWSYVDYKDISGEGAGMTGIVVDLGKEVTIGGITCSSLIVFGVCFNEADITRIAVDDYGDLLEGTQPVTSKDFNRNGEPYRLTRLFAGKILPVTTEEVDKIWSLTRQELPQKGLECSRVVMSGCFTGKNYGIGWYATPVASTDPSFKKVMQERRAMVYEEASLKVKKKVREGKKITREEYPVLYSEIQKQIGNDFDIYTRKVGSIQRQWFDKGVFPCEEAGLVIGADGSSSFLQPLHILSSSNMSRAQAIASKYEIIYEHMAKLFNYVNSDMAECGLINPARSFLEGFFAPEIKAKVVDWQKLVSMTESAEVLQSLEPDPDMSVAVHMKTDNEIVRLLLLAEGLHYTQSAEYQTYQRLADERGRFEQAPGFGPSLALQTTAGKPVSVHLLKNSLPDDLAALPFYIVEAEDKNRLLLAPEFYDKLVTAYPFADIVTGSGRTRQKDKQAPEQAIEVIKGAIRLEELRLEYVGKCDQYPLYSAWMDGDTVGPAYDWIKQAYPTFEMVPPVAALEQEAAAMIAADQQQVIDRINALTKAGYEQEAADLLAVTAINYKNMNDVGARDALLKSTKTVQEWKQEEAKAALQAAVDTEKKGLKKLLTEWARAVMCADMEEACLREASVRKEACAIVAYYGGEQVDLSWFSDIDARRQDAEADLEFDCGGNVRRMIDSYWKRKNRVITEKAAIAKRLEEKNARAMEAALEKASNTGIRVIRVEKEQQVVLIPQVKRPNGKKQIVKPVTLVAQQIGPVTVQIEPVVTEAGLNNREAAVKETPAEQYEPVDESHHLDPQRKVEDLDLLWAQKE